MKRLLILTACAALLMSGCRSCPWFKRYRGAPCRSNLTFDPYATAPAPVGPGCGLDMGEVSVGYAPADCPNCQPGAVVNGGVDYYGGETVMESLPGSIPTIPSNGNIVEPNTMPPTPPVGTSP